MPTVTPTPTGFNPLHCGAAVASHNYGWVPGHDYVCFNPLHCGAVVASRRFVAGGDPARSKFQSPSLRGSGRFDRASRARIAGYRVSIPFIAGQWSLRARRDAERRASKMFQSPSLRGSGRFMSSTRSASRTGACFNPLHCGAVVASRGRLSRWRTRRRRFNPLHCGAVVASVPGRPVGLLLGDVSIPFIAGQWSLRRCGGRRSPTCSCFNPLHCGAVVASLAEERCNVVERVGFNPLHCGAVVASADVAVEFCVPLCVSIPFIAGQWSLRRRNQEETMSMFVFQSPSLRGSGRFSAALRRQPPTSASFNPLHCGAVVASGWDGSPFGLRSPSFNPLHCGAVVASGP